MKIVLVLSALLALTACNRPQPTPTRAPMPTIAQTEVDTRCEEDEPCWVCSVADDRCSSRSF